MNQFIKNTWAFWAMTAFAVILTTLIWIPVSADQPIQIKQNEEISVNDELTKTIKIKLEDGISSSDEINQN